MNTSPLTKEIWRELTSQSEEALVRAIKKYLRTENQRDWLHDHDLTIEDLLNGRYPIKIGDEVERLFYRQWNTKLGWKAFGFYGVEE